MARKLQYAKNDKTLIQILRKNKVNCGFLAKDLKCLISQSSLKEVLTKVGEMGR